MAEGKISISRVNCSHREDYISICVTDEISGIRFLEVELSPENLSLALTGASLQSCVFQTHGLQNIGKKKEYKTELVQRPKKYNNGQELENILKPYEVDGWKAYRNDTTNHHNWTGLGTIKVNFTRYVDAENKQEDSENES